MRDVLVRDDDPRVIFGKSVVTDKAFEFLPGKFRNGPADFFDERFVDVERNKVGLREIAVIVRFFLAAHRDGGPFFFAPQPRFLNDPPAGGHCFALTFFLEFQRDTHRLERIHIL